MRGAAGDDQLVGCVLLQEQRLRYLKLQDQRQQQQQEASEQERLRQLRENAHNQEAKLRRVRALRSQVEQKRLSNSKLGQCGALLFYSVISFCCHMMFVTNSLHQRDAKVSIKQTHCKNQQNFSFTNMSNQLHLMFIA